MCHSAQQMKTFTTKQSMNVRWLVIAKIYLNNHTLQKGRRNIQGAMREFSITILVSEQYWAFRIYYIVSLKVIFLIAQMHSYDLGN